MIGSKNDIVLPDEYQRVEHIEGTGTQFINTGYHLSRGVYSFYADLTATGGGGSCFGVRDAATPNGGTFLVAVDGSASKFRLLAERTWKNLNYTISFDHFYSIYARLDDSRQSLTVDSHTVNTSQTINWETLSGMPLYVLGCNYNGNLTRGFGKVRRFRTVKDGKTVIDLIPCYRKSDGEIGMFDIASQTFYTNAGTGEFQKGADV